MTNSPQTLVKRAIKQAEGRVQTTRATLRRNTLAYIGMHGVAYDRAQEQLAKLRGNRGELLEDLVKKGEKLEERATEMFGGVRGKAANVIDDTKDAAWKLTPGAVVNKTEQLEADVKAAKAKLNSLTGKDKAPVKKAKKPTIKKPAVKKPAVKKPEAKKPEIKKPAVKKPAVKTAAPKAADVKAEPVKMAPAKAAAPKAAPTKPAKKEEPRHIPYFNDVKRYDPLANEDVVRKIVNHCGIALRNTDARYVACTDEAERNRVRDSWLKKKLELTGSDAELDKKVQNVCSIMQRDNKKNRVTFYYLAAKAARKLDTL